VPAIVVFAVVFGVAVQSISTKSSFLEVVEVIRLASLQIWTWVVYLAPIGVSALFASTAGTISPGMAGTLAVYIGLYLISTGVLAFVVLPLALSAIVPASARELLAELRPAFVLAPGDDTADVGAPAHPGRCRAYCGAGRT
jgi:Na+/H+-dicarboxylate symporter